MSANFPTGSNEATADASPLTGGRNNGAGANVGTRRSAMEHGESRRPRQSAESMRSELNNLKNDLDALVGQSKNLSERELGEAYVHMMTRVSTMRFAAKGIAAEATRQLNQGVDATSDYVREKPLQSVAIAAGVGLLFGMLMARR